MWPVMIANILTKGAWVAALVVLVLNDHHWWAAACLAGALLSEWTYERKQNN